MTSTKVIIGGLLASLLLILLCLFLNAERYYKILKFEEDNILISSSTVDIEANISDLLLPPTIIEKKAENKKIVDINVSTKSIKELNSSLPLSLTVPKVLIIEEAKVEEKKEENNNSLAPKEISTVLLKQEPLKIETIQKKIFELLQKHQITFKKNSGKIEKEGRKVLEKIVKLLSNNDNIFIEIQGHTDAGGKRKVNQRISQTRANRVKFYFTERGFVAKNIQALGFGESTLLFPKKRYSPLNRRVEIYIKRR
jgi:outer membrane protein OmpA-like peptidoglycan-associated protein